MLTQRLLLIILRNSATFLQQPTKRVVVTLFLVLSFYTRTRLKHFATLKTLSRLIPFQLLQNRIRMIFLTMTLSGVDPWRGIRRLPGGISHLCIGMHISLSLEMDLQLCDSFCMNAQSTLSRKQSGLNQNKSLSGMGVISEWDFLDILVTTNLWYFHFHFDDTYHRSGSLLLGYLWHGNICYMLFTYIITCFTILHLYALIQKGLFMRFSTLKGSVVWYSFVQLYF